MSKEVIASNFGACFFQTLTMLGFPGVWFRELGAVRPQPTRSTGIVSISLHTSGFHKPCGVGIDSSTYWCAMHQHAAGFDLLAGFLCRIFFSPDFGVGFSKSACFLGVLCRQNHPQTGVKIPGPNPPVRRSVHILEVLSVTVFLSKFEWWSAGDDASNRKRYNLADHDFMGSFAVAPLTVLLV
eukprot:2271628-Amphidinium_carterae.1